MKRSWRTWRDDFIIRVDDGPRRNYRGTRGFDVRLPGSYGLRNKYFGITRWGSAREALKQARRYRDAMAKQLGIPPRRRGKLRSTPFETLPRANNSTGAVGVTTNGRLFVAYYQVRPNKQAKRAFSIGKHGFEGARAKAIAWRKRMIGQLAKR